MEKCCSQITSMVLNKDAVLQIKINIKKIIVLTGK